MGDDVAVDIRWVRIVSWHAVRHASRTGRLITRCGRLALENAETRETLSSERSCESCLRLVARENDR